MGMISVKNCIYLVTLLSLFFEFLNSVLIKNYRKWMKTAKCTEFVIDELVFKYFMIINEILNVAI